MSETADHAVQMACPTCDSPHTGSDDFIEDLHDPRIVRIKRWCCTCGEQWTDTYLLHPAYPQPKAKR